MASMDIDMSLDDIVKQKKSARGGQKRGSYNNRRGGFRKQYGQSKPEEYRSSSSSFSKRSHQPREPRVPRQPPPGEKENQVKLSNLHYEINEDMLGNIFNGYNVTKLVLSYDKSGRSTGEAVVAFDKSDDADRAIEEFDGKTAKDQEIRVEPYGYYTVNPPPRQPHAGSGNDGSSLLSRLGAKVNSGPPPTAPRAHATHRSSRSIRSAGNKSKPRPAPKDSDDLDRELDDFMKKPGSSIDAAQDSEMS